MFQKSCLLKCIATTANDHSIFEQNFGLYKLKKHNESVCSSTVAATDDVSDKAKLSKKSTKEWRDSFKKSFNSTIKKSYRRIKKQHKTGSQKKENSQAINETTTIDMFKRPNVFSSTLVNNLTKYQHIESSVADKSKFRFMSMRSSESDGDDSDSDDDESDLDISMEQNDYDLNSSLSSVSSLEFEPFESSTCPSNASSRILSAQNSKKSIVKPPLISSSRSNITASISASSNDSEIENSRLINFESCTTSSRLSLLSSDSQRIVNSSSTAGSFVTFANLVRKQENNCSLCNNHQINQICSSTMINNTLNCNNTNVDFLISASCVSANSSLNTSRTSSSSLSTFSSCSSLNESLNNQTVLKKI